MQTFTTYGSSNATALVSVGAGTDFNWRAKEFFFNLTTQVGATAANTLTITKKSQFGQNYDVIIKAVPMFGVVDFHWQPTRPIELWGGDSLSVAWTNDASSFKTWALQVDYEV